MADTEMVRLFKGLPIKILTSKRKEREFVFNELHNLLAKTDLPPGFVKGICKLQLHTLHRYVDSKSRRLVQDLIFSLVQHHGEVAIKAMISVFTEIAQFVKKLSPTTNTARTCLTALSWYTSFVLCVYKNNSCIGDDFKEIIEAQCVLLSMTVATGHKGFIRKAERKLFIVWKSIPNTALRYADVLLTLDQTVHTIVMSSFLLKYFGENKNLNVINKYKSSFLESFIKIVVSSKVKPPTFVLINGQHILKYTTHEEFKETLLPAIQKAMLRNPEIILETVAHVLLSLTLDLSQYVNEIVKTLAKYLCSKDDGTREDAATACKSLAQQCSDAEALETVLKYLFSVLNGSEGKLTLTSQRMGVMTGIGNFSYNTVTGNSAQKLAFLVGEEIIPVLESEVHEGTLIHALSVLALWCSKFNNDVPSKLIDWFKKSIALKSSTSSVRNAYIQCMNIAFKGNTLKLAQSLIPLMLNTVENAASKSNQIAFVTEGLSVSYLLLRLMASDLQFDGKLNFFWNAILDNEKPLFFSENFLTHASDDALYHVILLTERLIIDHPDRLKNKTHPIYRAIVFVLTRPTLKLRRQSQTVVKKLLNSLGGFSLANALLKELSAFVASQKFTVRETNSELKENGEFGGGDNNLRLTSAILVETLMCFVSGSFVDVKDKEQLAFESLICAHHPIIFSEKPNCWVRILQHLSIKPEEFVAPHAEKIVELIYQTQPISLSAQNTIQSVVKINCESVMPFILKKIEKFLSNEEMLQVTLEDCNIFHTKKGQLYNKSVIEENKVETVQSKNIKRESKVYSYREQLEDIELRKEIEAKKKAQGKREVQLTPKQQEAVRLEIAKEDAIRDKLAKLNSQVISASNSILAAVRSKSDGIMHHVSDFVELLLPTFSSALAAPITTEVFISLHDIVLEEHNKNLGNLIAHIALRLMKPHCKLDPAWEEEDLLKAAIRTLELFHSETVRNETSIFEAVDVPEVDILCGPAFAYCFPFLQCVLRNTVEGISHNEQATLQALRILSEHAQMRGSITGTLYQPTYLPRKQMLELLVEVVGSHSGKIQQEACRVLLDVTASASGIEGCCRAKQEEIDVLLNALESHLVALREVALKALTILVLVLPSIKSDFKNGLNLIHHVWIARHDEEEEIKQLATKLWMSASLTVHRELPVSLLTGVTHPEAVIRQSAANALASVLSENRNQVPSILEKLTQIYRDKLVLPPPVLDMFGRVVSDDPVDNWEPRSGVALAIARMMPYFNQETVSKLMTFFVQEGLRDRHDEVQKNMLNAALVAVDTHGKETVTNLLPVFEKFLDKTPNKASFDRVRQSVVIIMGSLARHLEKDDPKVKPIAAKLIESLSTPSQEVQEAVANCLPPLVPAIKEETPVLVQKLCQLLLDSPSYGERKGASYGLAGLVKGLGILALKQLDIMATLTQAIQDKKNSRHREGALFAFEQLCNMLGRLFEPYIVHVLPHLLLCFGDQNHHVRVASDDTARAVMSKLSAHGVKLVLPSLLAALEEDSWRTKTGSVELLGAMAFCAPKQLSSCLPSIVPKLIEVLSDSHVKVQKAGAQALKQIGSVIRNPEIQEIVPNLLDALQDPSKKTAACLQTLLDTKFVHFIDAPSLALIMPVVQRAFQDRSTETRKMAAQIIGNMYSLTDQKDLAPYLPHITPGLKQSLLDPVPEVRSVSARALGAMVRGMGENNFEDLLPWLMQTLTSESSSVDRSGAAQGLSEVVGGLGLEKLHRLMPDIISTAERSDIAAHVKDGYIMMFIYMPVVFQKDFTPYIGQIINPILKALADETEFVRDTALRAGQRIVNMYAESAITLLLPELERGLFDDNWRIRYSSVQLLGDLLYKISGVSGKMSTETADEDDNFGTEHSHKAILFALGVNRRNRVLAGLYIGRSDVALMVRQAALHVWKVVVSNTPRTLREILPTLFSLLLGCLASTSYDKRQVAARTLGDLVRKLGERVLPEIIPILEKGLESDQADQRQGVCIGLSEIMASTSREMVLTFVDSLVPTVRRALCDPLPEVRQAAAKTFDSLHSTVGVRALDDILPSLLRQLSDPEIGEYTLDGLRQVMAIKSRVVLPYLIPQLTTPPVNTKSLSILAAVAGDSLTKHLHKILPALLSALSETSDTPIEQQELEYCQSVILSVNDNVGVRTVMDELLEATRTENLGVRRAATNLLCAFCLHTRADYQQYVPQLLRGLIHLFTDTDDRVLEISWEALCAVTKKLDSAVMLTHVGNVRQAVRFAVSDLKGQELLPGFCLPKGITPILPIFREAILNGAPELKEQAAQGLREVIKVTSAEALKPSVVHITGPLIRILGDRFNWNVKVAVLDALALLLAKVGVMLKAFLPQLQTTFVKALTDPNRQVRLRAADALSHLIIIHTRADPLFTELLTAVKNTDDSSIRETMLQALRVIITPAGNKMGDSVRKSVATTLVSMLGFSDDTTRMVAAGCLGALCKWLPEDELQHVVIESLLDEDISVERMLRQGRSVALLVALKETPERLVTPEWNEKVVRVLHGLVTADRVPLCLNGVRGSAYFFKYLISTGKPLAPQLVTAVAKSMNHTSNEVKQLVAQVANFLAKSFDTPVPDSLLKPLLPMLVNGTKEKNTMVRANSEFALVSLLHLRRGDTAQQATIMNLLDAGAREALNDVINKVLRKVASQPEPKEEELDDTLLT